MEEVREAGWNHCCDFRSGCSEKPLEGAKPLINLASPIPDLAITGQYFQDTDVAEPSKNAQNDMYARQLWDYSFVIVTEN